MTDAVAVGEPINLQPPNVFSVPVKLIAVTPGQSDVSGISIYLYTGEEWVLGCDSSNNATLEGWMVPGSRVNGNGRIELKVYHFSGIQAAVVQQAVPPVDGGDGSDDPADDMASCFIRLLVE